MLDFNYLQTNYCLLQTLFYHRRIW